MKRLYKLVVLAVAALAPLSALAADGYVNGYVNLRAGPDVRYPRVVTLPPGTPIAVFSCTSGWSWCDVRGDGARGWISANYVRYPYNNRRVVLSTYGGRIGIPIVNFVLDAYWGNHYRNRSWYPQRAQWARPGYRWQPLRYRPQRQGHYLPRGRHHYLPQGRHHYLPHPGHRPGAPGHDGKPPQGPAHGAGHGGHKPPHGGGGGG